MSKMKFTLLAGTFFLSGLYCYGQETSEMSDTLKNWKLGGQASLNFSQTSFSNWQAGGNESLSGLGLVTLFANYSNEKFSWDNLIDIKYGISKQDKLSPRKTDDNLELLSKFGYQASKNWYYSGSFSFKTQFAEGKEYGDSVYVISRFMAPAYFQLSLGMDYKPSEEFSLLLSPVTGKMTLVNDTQFSDEGKFGVKPGKKFRAEFGGSLRVFFKKEVLENVSLSSRLNTFINYTGETQIDIDWEAVINMKINKFLGANFIVQTLYDEDQTKDIKVKQVLGAGLNYKF